MAMENENHSLKIITRFIHLEKLNSITYLSKNTFLIQDIGGHKILNIEDNSLRRITNKLYPMVAINSKINLIALANDTEIISYLHIGKITHSGTNKLSVKSLDLNLYTKLFYPNDLSLKFLNFNPRNNMLILCLKDFTLEDFLITVNRFTNNRIESPTFATRTPRSVKHVVINPAQETLCVISDDHKSRWRCYIDLYSLNNLTKLISIFKFSTMIDLCAISHKNLLAFSNNNRIFLINLNKKDDNTMSLESLMGKKITYMAFYPTTSILVTTSSSSKNNIDQTTLCFWNTTTLQPIFESTLSKHSSLCDLSSDGKEMLIKSQNTYTIYSTPHIISREHIISTFPYILFLLKNISTQDNPKTLLLNDIAQLITYIYANKLSFY
jgi:hypothetical protein